MAIDVYYLPDNAGVHFHCYGVVTGHELLYRTAEHYDDVERMKGYRYNLVDFSQTSKFLMKPEEMEKLLLLNYGSMEYIPSCVVAIIAKLPVVYGYSREWQNRLAETSDWEVEVFSTIYSGKSFLKKRVAERYSIKTLL